MGPFCEPHLFRNAEHARVPALPPTSPANPVVGAGTSWSAVVSGGRPCLRTIRRAPCRPRLNLIVAITGY